MEKYQAEKSPLETAVERQQKVVRRRELFARAFTDEVLEALEEWLGVRDAVFAFAPNEGGRLDALEACRRDTLMGVVRGIRFEVEHKAEGEKALEALMNHFNHRKK